MLGCTVDQAHVFMPSQIPTASLSKRESERDIGQDLKIDADLQDMESRASGKENHQIAMSLAAPVSMHH